jgi:hypothetical protein
MSIMTDDEKVLANTEIEKLTRLTKYYRLFLYSNQKYCFVRIQNELSDKVYR